MNAISAVGFVHFGTLHSYRSGDTNHCPDCHQSNWFIGRIMAECAFCGAALALAHVHSAGALPGRRLYPERHLPAAA